MRRITLKVPLQGLPFGEDPQGGLFVSRSGYFKLLMQYHLPLILCEAKRHWTINHFTRKEESDEKGIED